MQMRLETIQKIESNFSKEIFLREIEILENIAPLEYKMTLHTLMVYYKFAFTTEIKMKEYYLTYPKMIIEQYLVLTKLHELIGGHFLNFLLKICEINMKAAYNLKEEEFTTLALGRAYQVY